MEELPSMVEQSLVEQSLVEKLLSMVEQSVVVGSMSGGTFHSGEPLLDDWVFPDNFTSEYAFVQYSAK